jgi:hypothetical protein
VREVFAFWSKVNFHNGINQQKKKKEKALYFSLSGSIFKSEEREMEYCKNTPPLPLSYSQLHSQSLRATIPKWQMTSKIGVPELLKNLPIAWLENVEFHNGS